VRHIGFERLKARGEAARPAVWRLLDDGNPFQRARAVWLLAALGPAGVADVERLLADGDPQIRITAFRALRQVRPDVLAVSRRLAADPSPAVRREVALALRDVPFEQSGDLLVALAAGFDGQDRWYLEALGIGASGKEAALYAALTSSANRADPLTWDTSMAALAWRLHPPAAIDAFAGRAAAPSLSGTARAQALTGLGFVNHPRAAQAMADLTGSPLRDVATAAAWWLTYRKSNDWREYPVEGWAVAVTEERAVPRDELVAHRALVVDGDAPIDRRIEATLALAETGPGGRLLIGLAAENRLVYQLREAAGSLIFINPDRSVRAAASGYFQRPGGQMPMPVDAVTRLAGDPGRGAAHYRGACATCHRHGDTGADVGPDLTTIHTKFDRGGLIEAIVQPNAAIAFGFAADVFVTDDEHDPQIGFLQADGPTVTIRDGHGRMISFDRDRVAKRLPLKSSLMPDPVGLGLTEQDVADVVAYLMR
jgi:putative heme-binding domain-containing protein